jgi:hemerythrin-like domain-containing protein
MKALEYLRQEHRRIEQMLAALDAVADTLERSGTAPVFAADLLDFFEQYADVGHHEKEERFLFPALARHGVGPEGMIEAMEHQHEIGRVHVRDMRRHLDRARRGDRDAAAAFVTSARAFVELLRVHIQIEDDDLYPLAGRLFGLEEDRELTRQFAAADGSRDALERQARWDLLLSRVHEIA